MSGSIAYDDVYGSVIDYPGRDLLEIRWYDATSELDRDGFNRWLQAFTGVVEQHRRAGILVDATQFRMPPEHMDTVWRDEHIVPRYNSAGVRKFAFLMPAQMPAVGSPPAPEGPAAYPTAYFARRREAIAWLAS
jgi:hypothetical protein